jgi:hypothetical protein
MAQLRAQIAAMQAKIEASRQAEKIARIEDQIVRFLQSSTGDFERGAPGAESTLRRAVERIESEDAKRHLPRADDGAAARRDRQTARAH